MHQSVDDFVGEQVAQLGLAGSATLEVGSLDLNGSIRHHFLGEHVGLDIYDGPGVDVVYDGDVMPWPDDAWPAVVSAETLEHAAEFWTLAAEMVRVLAPGGWLILTTRANGFPDHAVPHEDGGAGADRWRFMPGALRELFERLGLVLVQEWPDPQAPGIFLIGRKPS